MMACPVRHPSSLPGSLVKMRHAWQLGSTDAKNTEIYCAPQEGQTEMEINKAKLIGKPGLHQSRISFRSPGGIMSEGFQQ